MDSLQLVSIALEVAVVVVAVMVGMRGRVYGYGFAATYALYTFYDLAKFYDWSIPSGLIDTIFFVATASALWAVWMLFKSTRS